MKQTAHSCFLNKNLNSRWKIQSRKKDHLNNYFQIRNPQGQSLVEYLIIVTLIAVTTIGMIKGVGTNITVHFANISKALAGDSSKEFTPVKVQADQVQTRGLKDYMRGASSGPSK